MANFLVERYFARTCAAGARRDAEKVRRAADELRLEGTTVRCLSSVFVPEDETSFHLYEAESMENVREAVQRAALSLERITEAIAFDDGGPQALEDGEIAPPASGRS